MNLIIIQARMGSSRLPGKVLKKLYGKEILLWCYDRCSKSKADKVVIATSTNAENDVIECFLKNKNIECFRGNENDLLDRYYQLAKSYSNDVNVIRVTSDCPFVDTTMINNMIDYYNNNDYDYIINHSSNCIIPEGSGIEIINFKTLKMLWEKVTDNSFREHATGLLSKINPFNNVKIGYYNYLVDGIRNEEEIKFVKLSIDTHIDYENSLAVVSYFQSFDFTYDQILKNIDNSNINLKR